MPLSEEIFQRAISVQGELARRGQHRLPIADLVIAADSGYDAAVSAGYAVDVLVGDMDSIATEAVPGHVIVERHDVDKDATDLELALAKVIAEKPQRMVIVGGGGGRVDHELATAALICSADWDQVEEIDWVTHRGWAHVVRGRRVLHGDVGRIISLIPMGGAAVGGIVGSAVGHPGAGAAVGGALGVGAGALIGDQIQALQQRQAELDKQLKTSEAELQRQREELDRIKKQSEE